MAEEVKKAPRPVDPNSAKYKLGKIAGDVYAAGSADGFWQAFRLQ